MQRFIIPLAAAIMLTTAPAPRLRVNVAESGIHVCLKAKRPYLFQSLRFRI